MDVQGSQQASDDAFAPSFVPDTPMPLPAAHVKIASEAELEEFGRLPWEERQLTDTLRGVLVESALTGHVRYSWDMLRPLVEYALDQTLRQYEARDSEDSGGVGPPRPARPGESLQQTISRFRHCLSRFTNAPWTLQRLCEVLLAPQKQYTKLHKVTLAIEKCLFVTSEIGVTSNIPPSPLLSELRSVNENPPPVFTRDVPVERGVGTDQVAATSEAFMYSLLDVSAEPPRGAPAAHTPASTAAGAQAVSNGPHQPPAALHERGAPPGSPSSPSGAGAASGRPSNGPPHGAASASASPHRAGAGASAAHSPSAHPHPHGHHTPIEEDHWVDSRELPMLHNPLHGPLAHLPGHHPASAHTTSPGAAAPAHGPHSLLALAGSSSPTQSPGAHHTAGPGTHPAAAAAHAHLSPAAAAGGSPRAPVATTDTSGAGSSKLAIALAIVDAPWDPMDGEV